MKGCQNARYNTKYIKKFVFKYCEVFFTHRETVVILKGSQKANILKENLNLQCTGKGENRKKLSMIIFCIFFLTPKLLGYHC